MNTQFNESDFLGDILKNRKITSASFHKSKPYIKYEKVNYKLTFIDKVFRFFGLKDIPKEGSYIIFNMNF